MADARINYFDTCFEKSKVRHLVDFFSTRCRTSDKTKIDQVSDLAVFFSTSTRIRRVVIFDERILDEKTTLTPFLNADLSLPRKEPSFRCIAIPSLSGSLACAM